MNTRKIVFQIAICLCLLVLLYPLPAYAAPLDNWHVRNSVPGGYTLNAVAYGNGMFVGVGSQGAILSSPDGATWTPRTSGTSAGLNGAAFGNGLFVVVGDAGTILTSPDGTSWTAQTSGTGVSLDSAAYGNGIFVVVSGSSTNLTSPDGVNWTVRNSPEMGRIAFGDGQFLALGFLNSYYVSQDGTSWTFKLVVLKPDGAYSGIAVHNGTYVLVGVNFAPWFVPSPVTGQILTSPNGDDWTLTYRSAPEQTGRMLLGITYGNGYFVAVGNRGTVHASPDGYSWNNLTTTTDSVRGVIYGNRTFVAVGSNGLIIQSDPMIEAVGVPTLSEWGMILIVISFGFAAIRSLQTTSL